MKKIKPIKVLLHILLVVFAIVQIYPLLFLAFFSLKDNNEIYSGNVMGIPREFHWSNYQNALFNANVGHYLLNSIFVTAIVILISDILACMVSYAISRMEWKLSKITMSVFMLGMMIPVYAMVVPLFSMFNKMGLLNTHLAVIIPHIAISFPMTIFILTGFMGSIPKELEEAAVMDGCTIYQIFFKIIMPISKSSIVTVAVVTFINIWNDLLLPQIFLTDSTKMTLPVGLTEFQGQYTTNYVVEIAAVILTIIPSILVYMGLHKNIMEGMVSGAVKG